MVSSGVLHLDQILSDGYPEKSSILVNGPPGIGKEALGYWFIHSGLVEGDSCFYLTHRTVADVLKNMKAFGIRTDDNPEWMASSGSQKRCDLNDPVSLSSGIKDVVSRNRSQRVRIVTDVLSPLLVMNSPASMYRFFSELLTALKENDVVLLATVEEGMHPPDVLASMEQLFDGVIDLRIYETGLSLTPLLRIKKMLGLPPVHSYFRFTFARGGMEITGSLSQGKTGKMEELGIGGWLRGPNR